MEKTDNFFVISNYNVDPENLTKYANDYLVYDQSDEPDVVERNKAKQDSRIVSYPNTGHNHIVFFKYIIDNYNFGLNDMQNLAGFNETILEKLPIFNK